MNKRVTCPLCGGDLNQMTFRVSEKPIDRLKVMYTCAGVCKTSFHIDDMFTKYSEDVISGKLKEKRNEPI